MTRLFSWICIALFAAAWPAYAQRATPVAGEPESAAEATAYPVPVPQSGGAFPSSGGYRPRTEAGREEGPVITETPRTPAAAIRREAMPAPAPMSRLERKTQNGISWLCGGIGVDEADRMKQSARDYNLMLTFSGRDGAYLADVNVDIADEQGQSLVKVACNGPIMLVDMERSGNYRVRAETGGSTVTRLVKIAPRDAGKSVVMVWPASEMSGRSPRD